MSGFRPPFNRAPKPLIKMLALPVLILIGLPAHLLIHLPEAYADWRYEISEIWKT